MAISEDLRSVQAMLGSMKSENAGMMRLLCDNLAALADQVEALEEVPLALPSAYTPVMSVTPVPYGGVPLQ